MNVSVVSLKFLSSCVNEDFGETLNFLDKKIGYDNNNNNKEKDIFRLF